MHQHYAVVIDAKHIRWEATSTTSILFLFFLTLPVSFHSLQRQQYMRTVRRCLAMSRPKVKSTWASAHTVLLRPCSLRPFVFVRPAFHSNHSTFSCFAYCAMDKYIPPEYSLLLSTLSPPRQTGESIHRLAILGSFVSALAEERWKVGRLF